MRRTSSRSTNISSKVRSKSLAPLKTIVKIPKEVLPKLEEAKELKATSTYEMYLSQLIKEKQNNQEASKHKIFINITKAKKSKKLIDLLLIENNWKSTNTKSHNTIHWLGSEIKQEEFYLAIKNKVNRIPGMYEMCSKTVSGYFLNLFQKYFPYKFQFYPKTFLFPQKLKEIKDYIKVNPYCLLIAKPSNGSQGQGISFIKSIKDLYDLRDNNIDEKYVIQEYIKSPLIIDNKKHDFRLYLLISNTHPLEVYLHEEGMVRFCTEDYKPPSKENLKKQYIHLTNYHLNKDNKAYSFSKECNEINSGSKRTLSSYWKSLEYKLKSTNHCISFESVKEMIWSKIKEIVKNLFTAMYPYILHNYTLAYNDKKGSNFHIIGMDILIDSDLNPWLIELNANPSYSIEYEEEFSPIDYYIKKKVVSDSIELIALNDKDINQYKGFTKVSSISKSTIIEGDMNIFIEILEVFKILSGVKFSGVLSNTKFSKIGTFKGMINDHLKRFDYDIIYTSVTKGFVSSMTYYTFIEAIEKIAERIILYQQGSKLGYDTKCDSLTSKQVLNIFEFNSNLDLLKEVVDMIKSNIQAK